MPGYARPCFCTKRGSGSLVNIVIAIPDDVKFITTIFLLTDSWNEQRCSHAFVRFSDEDPTMTTDKKYRPRTKPTEKGWYGPVLSSYCHEIKRPQSHSLSPTLSKQNICSCKSTPKKIATTSASMASSSEEFSIEEPISIL